MFDKLTLKKIPLPTNVPHLLALENKEIYKILYRFIITNRIEL